MQRHEFTHGDVTLSYLDTGGDAPLIVALHALWMEAGTYRKVAERLAPDWRLVSLDQRGHGFSSHAADYSISAFVKDVEALLDHLQVPAPVVLMGNSMGAMVAFHFAVRHPDRVRGMVNEEGPAYEKPELDFVLEWAGEYPSEEALRARIGDRLAWSVEPSFREIDGKWSLAFDPEDIVRIAAEFSGDCWPQWLGSDCPALVIRGTDSRAVDGCLMAEMAERRPNTQLATLEGGHVVHEENMEAFLGAVIPFLQALR